METLLRNAFTALAVVMLGAAILPAQLADKKGLTLEIAKQLAAVAEKEAANNKWTMVIAILDEGGNLLLLHRMDETQIGSVDVAVAKAKSAYLFKRPTKAFEDAVAGGRTAVIALPGAMPIEGGLPIEYNGRIIGAIGASGGTSPQDGIVAKAAIDALPKMIK
jgi:uncharacterized protein GlcG (DUF336 family)